MVTGQKIQGERCWHDQRTTPKDNELPMTGKTEASVEAKEGVPTECEEGFFPGGGRPAVN